MYSDFNSALKKKLSLPVTRNMAAAGVGSRAGRLAGSAIGTAGLLIFLNYQYVLVKPNVVQRLDEPPTRAPPRADPQPAPAPEASEAPSDARTDAALPFVGEHTNRISQLEAEVAVLREQLAQARAPVRAPARRSAGSASVAGAAAAAPAERECPHPCGPDGTCNRALGECSCPPHRTGRNCSEPMFPACASMWGYSLGSAPCGLPEATFPLTCECALQCDAANLLMRRMCVQHRPPTEEVARAMQRWRTGPMAERWTMTVLQSERTAAYLHEKAALSRQQNLCSGHGIRMPQLPRWLDPPGPVAEIPAAKFDPSGPAVCVCMPSHWGAQCEHEIRSRATCLNGCNGRGRCVHATCACEAGFWGADCSLRINPAGGYSSIDPPRPRSGVTASVYVYELPNRFTTWLAAQSNAHEWTHSWWFYDNDISLHQRLLASPYRTADPSEADFFFVPLYRSLGAYTAGWGPGVVTPKGWRAYGAALTLARTSWPYFDRPGGAAKHSARGTVRAARGRAGAAPPSRAAAQPGARLPAFLPLCSPACSDGDHVRRRLRRAGRVERRPLRARVGAAQGALGAQVHRAVGEA